MAKADAAVLLEKALVDQEMLVQPEGDKFVLLIPVGQARLLAPIPELPSLDAVPDEIIPAGIIKFQDTDLLQVLDIYGDLTGRTLLRPNSLPPTKISVRSQTSLARKEAVWLLDALLAVSGIAMAPEGRNFVFAVPTSRMHNLPKFKENIAAAKATKVAPPQKMRFDDASVTKLVEAYGHLLGREPAPVDKYMSAVKFSFHTQKELSQAEAIFAVEAVAALNNLRLELVGDDQVQIVPAATPRSGNR